jgi:DNA-binding beta-propeller fold protein YncE
MSFRRVGWAAAILLAAVFELSCGEVYRPVVIPTNTTPPNPGNYHAVFSVNMNAPGNVGSALQIDVSGDTNAGQANMGFNPTHAGILPNNSRVFVANAGSIQCGTDIVYSFTPAPASATIGSIGTPVGFTYPISGTSQSSSINSISEDATGLVTVTLAAAVSNAVVGAPIQIISVGTNGFSPYNGCFTITAVGGATIQYRNTTLGLPTLSAGGTATVPASCPYLPDFVATAQTNNVYVANFGAESGLNCGLSSTDSVAQLNTASNTITNLVYLPAGSHPVAMAETPDAQNLYVLNQGKDTVSNLSPTDLSTLATINLPSGSSPTWVVSRVDGQRVYVVTQGDGKLYTINTATNAVDGGVSVGGTGANYVVFDKSRNRLYATNPVAQTVNVFDATTDPSPTLLTTISMAAGPNSPCPGGCTPVSVTALPDGSRFYIASYQLPASCPDTTLGSSGPCIIPMLTIYDAASLTLKPAPSTLLPSSPSLSLLSAAQFAATQYAVPIVNSCAATGPYNPHQTRFRMFTTSAADSSHVYVSLCDAATIADVITVTNSNATGNNTPDTLSTNITPGPASCSGVNCGVVASITAFQIASNIVTFTSPNNFTPGEQVSISGLTTQTGMLLNSQTMTVIATGLSSTQFECMLPPSLTGTTAQPTSDTGSAIPLPPAQNPIFLVTGQ